MNPKPFSSLNHFTVPVAIFSPSWVCALRNAEGAKRQQLRKREARLWSNRYPTRRASVAVVTPGDRFPSWCEVRSRGVMRSPLETRAAMRRLVCALRPRAVALDDAAEVGTARQRAER